MPPSRNHRVSIGLASVLAVGTMPLIGSAPATAAESTTYLSALPWTSAVNGLGPVERDRSNGGAAGGDGRTLTLQGQTFDHGLGVHADSDVRFIVPAGCSRFTSVIGVDDAVGSKGSVTFSVYDGSKHLYKSAVLKGNSLSKDVSTPVTPGQVLRLVVSNAGDGPSNDHADWAGARLTCTPPPAQAPAPAPSAPSTSTPSAPSTSTLNLLPNPGAEVGTDGWSGINGSLTRSTSAVRSGSGSFALTSSTTGHVLLIARPTTSGITPGAILQVSAWVRSAAVARSAVMLTDWSSSSGGYLSTTATPSVMTTAGGWTQLTRTLTVPAGAVKASFYIKLLGTVPGEVHYVDDMVVETDSPTATSPSPAPSPTAPTSPTASPSPTAPRTPTESPAPAPDPATPTSPTSTTGPKGQTGTWQTLFTDDFDGTALDMTKWSDHEAWQRGGYVDTSSWNPSPHTAQQVAVADGQVSLKARRGTNLPQGKPFTSAHLNSRGKFSIPAGVTSYTEARIKAPSGKGLLPGFWLLGNGDSSTGQGWPITGEIDILEFANNNRGEAGSPYFSLWYPKDVYTNAPGTWLNATHVYHTDTAPKRFDLYDTYHTWGLYRSPEKMELYIDGVRIATYRPNEVHNGNIPLPPMLFTNAQHIRMSLIVGGWGGSGFTEAQYQEGDLSLDYIKVWQQTRA